MLPRIYIACLLFLSCSSSRMTETDLYFGTMTMVDANGDPRDSIFLSEDENATRKKKTRMRVMRGFQYEQNFKLCPTTLLYKKDRLYVIQHGRRQKKKIRNGYYIEPFVPWYVRSID